jgi:hypothetical protein
MTKYSPINGAIALDLFGTLVLPPDPAHLKAMMSVGWADGPEAVEYAANGFPAALLVAEMGLTLDDGVVQFLRAPFRDAEALVAHLRSRHPEAKTVKPETLRLVDELTAFVIEHTVLAPRCGEVLEQCLTSGMALQLVSDVSQPFSRVIDRLDLRRWFPCPILSWRTGRLKRDGAAFRDLKPPSHGGWTTVGDSWRSDVIGGLVAGHSAIFVDATSRHAARDLVRDVRPLLEVSDDTDAVWVRGPYREALGRFLPVPLKVIEADPGGQFFVRPDGTIGLRCLERVSVVSGISDLWPQS